MDKYYLYEVINTNSVSNEIYLGITKNIDKHKVTLMRKLYNYCKTGEGYNPVFHIMVRGDYLIHVLMPLSESYIKSIKVLNDWIRMYDFILGKCVNNYEGHIPKRVRDEFVKSFDEKLISYYTCNKHLHKKYYEQNREKILQKYRNLKNNKK